MVVTGHTSSDSPEVVPQSEWILDKKHKDIRRESKICCNGIKANQILLFLALAIAGTWISSLQQSVANAEVSLDLSVVMLDSCKSATLRSQRHFEETFLPKHLNGSNSSHYEILGSKKVLCENMKEKDKAKIENSIGCFAEDHSTEHFNAECFHQQIKNFRPSVVLMIFQEFFNLKPPPFYKRTTEEGVSFETMQRMNCTRNKTELFKKHANLYNTSFSYQKNI